ncbi:MAG: ATP-dependent 6-phosphofructokinase [Phycisphaerae bacterium]|nr:ATP-dependent 6-phosphofructokinase [Phycisphaerae bacterium]
MTERMEKIAVRMLGECRFASPLSLSNEVGDGVGNFVRDDTWVRYQIEVRGEGSTSGGPLFEKAGPRERLFFSPTQTKAAIVTCGGLCPGLNNVIRSAFLELHYNYGVPQVLGLRYGYRGLNPVRGHSPIRLTPEMVERVDKQGGTFLGTSRGAEEAAVMVDYLQRERIDVLFCVGGDGTLRGAHHIQEEIQRRGGEIAVVGIPKTIDNDIQYCWRTFGYGTSLETAREILQYAHNEAKSALNGIGLVKVMGRDAGFIAAGAALASQEANFTLIPEVPLVLDGEKGFLHVLERRLVARGHAVIVVAEGAGQDLFEVAGDERDASGNPRHHDIGTYLKARISEHLRARHVPFDLKYIDPSYIIRSVPANSEDSILCDQFARRAVHAAMSGRTDVSVGFANGAFFHVPLAMVTSGKKQVNPEGEMWLSVLAATGQPRSWR